jgi:hypothetical protein
LVGRFGIAFFFVMWFVGQYLRAAKQLQDADQLGVIATKVDSIAAAMTASAAAQGVAAPASGFPVPIQDTVSRVLMDEAHAAIQSGNTFAGLLTASVAFDHAVESAVRRLGASLDFRGGLVRHISWLAQFTGRDIAKELHALRDARNRLIHLRGEPPDLSAADRIWTGFRWAVWYLEQIRRPEAEAPIRS